MVSRGLPSGSACAAWTTGLSIWGSSLNCKGVSDETRHAPPRRTARAIGVTVPVLRVSTAGIAGGFATEWTQLANNLQLVNSYIRQGEQLRQEILMVLDMAK